MSASAAGARRRAGFVAVLGAPNAGKSTLVNRLVGGKVTIVSPKVQTTRTTVRGIVMHGATQVVLVDTPGIFAPKRRLDRAMVHAAWQGAGDADLLLLLVDAARPRIDADTRRIAEGLKQVPRPAFLVLNKIDLLRRETLLARSAELNALHEFERTFMISAETGDGCADLLDAIAARLPEGPWLYPEDQLADMPLRLLAAEVTREQVFLKLHDELPYAATVETETWEEFQDGSVRIGQVVFVERDGQRRIVLGAGGRMIKAIGAAARLELERALGRRVHLSLFVKVRERWQEDPARYAPWGLDPNA